MATTLYYVIVQLIGRLPTEEFGPFATREKAEEFIVSVSTREGILNAKVDVREEP